MIDNTFEIKKDGDEYTVHCYGELDGQLYQYVIRTDNDGKWINDGRALIPITNEYRDITLKLSVHDFENIKNHILRYGDTKTYCTIYSNNPHYTFDYLEVYLNPEIGQFNVNCNPEISDFNEIVIRDQNSDPQYYILLIIRQGDLAKSEIADSNLELKEEKIYLLNYYEYNFDTMEVNVSRHIDLIMKNIDQ